MKRARLAGALATTPTRTPTAARFRRALPWIETLTFWATIDGERWFDETYGYLGGTRPPGYGGTRIYRLCDERSLEIGQQLEAGPHELVIHAELVGTAVQLATEPITVELNCEADRQDVGPETEVAGGGCSAVPKRTQDSSPVLAVMGLCVCLRRRKPLQSAQPAVD